MINPKYTSIKEIIERIYVNAGYQQVDWNSALVYMQELIGLLGIPKYYVTKITNGETNQLEPIKIIEGRGDLPFDMIKPVACREFTDKVPMVYSTDLYHLTQNYNTTDYNKSYSNVDHTTFQDITEDTLITDPYVRAAFYNFKVQYQQEIEYRLSDKWRLTDRTSVPFYTYSFNESYIYTDFSNGYVEMVYKAIPLDDDGFPLIPDDEKIKRAFTEFIIWKLDYKLWRQGKLPDKVYQKSEQEKSWAIASAKSNANIPSIDEMESLKNSLNRLNPKINQHATGMRNNSQPETLHIHPSRTSSYNGRY